MTSNPFSLAGRVAVITGGTGAIGSAIAQGMARAGAHVAVIARNAERVTATSERIVQAGYDAVGIAADVLDVTQLERARDTIFERYGAVHTLVNCAGGNVAAATLDADDNPLDLPVDAFREVVDLNLLGTLLPVRVFGRAMENGSGCSIVNVSSMAASRALTRVGGYGAAKSAVESITRSLAVELARRGTGIRVNAIAPGFLVGDQNRALLVREDGELTDRGTAIVRQTPLGRFGDAEELVSTVIWLTTDGARFVTGVVVPVDGGFSAFSGV